MHEGEKLKPTFAQVDRPLISAPRMALGVGNGSGGGGIALEASFSVLIEPTTSLLTEPLCERGLGAMVVLVMVQQVCPSDRNV
jgi:hypothetical protein